ncbi:hypothetical protein RJ639_028367 [Escallonia herrerae]|uniref:RRM domain-containing protein n=1 Tax=Escallonia herrerae TaxID=1293975 RepID=A0AA89BQD0_9ASTE|nr:hypothetical protein RJ639_028367 [Escallonia herrerae]
MGKVRRIAGEDGDERDGDRGAMILELALYFMESSSEAAEYAAFEEKVRRTVFLDNLSHQVTEAVLKSALSQFGTVTSIQFIPSYMEPKDIPRAALVEMENSKKAEHIVLEMANFPFMISGQPRPVRAFAAEVEMFDDRPKRPGRRIQCRWLDRKDPEFKVAQNVKHLARKQAAEALFLLKQQLAQEKELANKQAETLKAHNKKFELIEGAVNDGSFRRLEKRYNINVPDD